MSDAPPDKELAALLQELKRAQRKAARLGLVLTASLIGMAALDVRDETIRRDEIVHVNDNPGDDHGTS